jgi:hypothetical protein
MKITFFFFTTLMALTSCAHHDSADRKVAAESCWSSIKPEYQTYFDSVEKCLEKSPQ